MTTAVKLDREATRADLDQLPDNVVGEIIAGVLYTHPRPRARHADIESLLMADLKTPYQRGRGGPGGWWILAEPGLELEGAPEVVPDAAGWRRERLAQLPEDSPIQVVPDWICEIHSPTTRGYDLVTKRRLYASLKVGHLWYIDPEARTLTVSALADGRWVEVCVHGETERVRCPPFADVELDLSEWWPAEP